MDVRLEPIIWPSSPGKTNPASRSTARIDVET
jgi:hypothetical protein